MIWLSSSASEYNLSSGIKARASSRRPGFSYLVGVTDRTWSRFRNFSEDGSCGGAGTIGRPLIAGDGDAL